ncbi:hypothetical protein RJT34_19666 [Clitoria ternatea]|uniref:CID domain-containing protein n=1 Tax=Clitoria ternatea TaxID=43366 RepID=A0AAN9P435_CLITE
MESARRSLDRSREPGPKKPRLIDELDRTARQLPQRQPASAAVNMRFRSNDRDSDSGAYHPQPPPHQELVSQYKTALAELTFNSKPIITNLTIIAGESISAAEAIANTVCANILEVRSELKLPSLYLLDSIVKNIGQDYIKYFAARLPEVFCKAYAQVDPAVHSSMKHLFGTWKGVFPPQTLRMIEKELGFGSAVNGSASVSAAARSDLQSQRPPHSIHVNPKYLERQRLQQSSRSKGVVNDLSMTGAILNSKEDSERPDRALGASRPWLDPRINSHNNQHSTHRDAFNDSVPEKNIGGSYGGSEYSSGISSNLVSGIGKTGSRLIDLGHNKTWLKTGSAGAETISGQRNDFSLKHSLSNNEALKPVNLDAHHQPQQDTTNIRSNVMSSNWKNSEEEEFMWDEMNSGLTDHGPNVSSNLSTESWMADDENLEGEDHLHINRPFGEKVDGEISTVKKQLPGFGGLPLSSWQLQKQHSVDNLKPGHSEGFVSTLSGLPGNTSSLAVKIGNRSFIPNATVGIAKAVGQQHFGSGGTESPSGQSPLRQQSPSLPATLHSHSVQNLADQQIPHNLKTSKVLGGLRSQQIRDSSTTLRPNVLVGNLRISQEKDMQGPLSSATSFRPKLQQLDSSQHEVTGKTKPRQAKAPLARETSEQSGTNNLSAAAVKSGNKSITSGLPTTSSLSARSFPSQSRVRPTQSSGPSPTTLVSSGSLVASLSSLGPLNNDSSTRPKIPQVKAGQPQKVSTTPSASSNVSSSSALSLNAANAKNSTLNPIANLLSSLVAKGLITAETESPTAVPNNVLLGSKDQIEIITTTCSSPVTSVSGSPAIPVPSSGDEVDTATKTSLTLPKSAASIEIRNLIGFDFRPDVIREFHPPVIKELLDDLPHHCQICGVRLKHQEQFNRHLEWHDTREKEQNGLTRASRRWYAKPSDWITGKAEYPSEFEYTDPVDVYDKKSDTGQLDPMVLADENQCLCVLCGEVFEDVYCQERDEWMFKGAVYMNYPDSNSEMESRNLGPIIHARCLLDSSISRVAYTDND